MYIHTFINTHINISQYPYTYKLTHIHTHTHTHPHTHTHIHTHRAGNKNQKVIRNFLVLTEKLRITFSIDLQLFDKNRKIANRVLN